MGETQRCVQSRTMAPPTGTKAEEGMKLLTHHHLEPRVRISGVIPPLPHILILAFGWGYVPDPAREAKNLGILDEPPPPNNVSICF